MKRPSNTLIRPWTLAPLAAALALSLSACGGGGGGGTTPGGTANFALTDAPICAGITSVFVTVTGVELVGPSGTYDLSLSTPIQVDLATLTNGQTLPLGTISVPAGTYQQVRLILASNNGNGSQPANYVVDSTGAQHLLTTPSAQQSGYKINGQFTVAPNGQANLVVDFNACRSVVMAGNSGKYILKPVLNLTDDALAGSITGYLPAADVGAVVMAEDSLGHILKTTVAAPGAAPGDPATFTLAPLLATTTSYTVVIAPPATLISPSSTLSPNFAPDVILNVPVVVGSTATFLGTPAQPLQVFDSTTSDQTFSGSVTLSAQADTLFVAQETLPNSGPVISLAQFNGMESDATPLTETYALTVPTAPPYVGTFGNSILLNQLPSPLPITIQSYASDGEYGSIPTSPSGSSSTLGTITLTGMNNGFEMDH